MIPNTETLMFPLILSRGYRKRLHPISTSKCLATPQTRKLWRGSSRIHEHYNHRGQRHMKIHRYLDLVRMWGRPSHPWLAQIYNRHHRWWNWAKSWEESISEHKRRESSQKDFWDDEGARIQRMMAQIKKEIETGPYGALFGRRLEPFSALNKFEDTCASLYRSLFGLDKPENTGATDTIARSKQFKNNPTTNEEGKGPSPRKPENEGIADSPQKKSTIRYEFDPVSGRMVPKSSRSTDGITEKGPTSRGLADKPTTQEPETQRKRNGYLSSIDRTDVKSRATPAGCTNSGVSDDSPRESKLDKNSESECGSEQSSMTFSETDDGLCKPPGEFSPPGKATLAPENEPDQHGTSQVTFETDQPKPIEPQCPGSSNAASPSDLLREESNSSDAKSIGRDQKEKAEDLDILQASDIRSRYDPGKFQRASVIRDQMRSELSDVSKASTDSTSGIYAQDARKRSEIPEQKQLPDTTAPESKTPGQVNSSVSTEPQHPEIFDHTQPLSPSDSHSAETYRVLAYDPSTLKITHAETSTSLHQTNESCHPSEVLSRLNYPAKFLPYFARMHTDGYEISSGGGDLLVFRKSFAKREHAGSSLEKLANEAQDIKAHLRNESLLDEEPLKEPKLVFEQNLTHSTAGAASEDLSGPSTPDEGSSRRSRAESFENKSSIGSAARRMFISGAATAATCYAIGVVIEYFRTGGEDGLGIDAFTEFESERRRRDLRQTE